MGEWGLWESNLLSLDCENCIVLQDCVRLMPFFLVVPSAGGHRFGNFSRDGESSYSKVLNRDRKNIE